MESFSNDAIEEEIAGPSLAEILSALSHALDLTEGQPRGHAVRTALVARRIAHELKLGEAGESNAFYAGLLKDSGCSTNAARIQKAFGGDELESKRDVKFVDWSQFHHAAIFAMSHSDRGAPAGARLRKALELIRTPPEVMDEVTLARCTRGAEIASQLGFGKEIADAVRNIDEHWDGRGSPDKAKRDEIPLLARVVCISQTFELFASEIGQDEAYNMLRKRRARWFDPEMVRILEALRDDSEFWTEQAQYRGSDAAAIVLPEGEYETKAADVDQICTAFASIVDAKSSFTAEHSSRVTKYAVSIGRFLELSPKQLVTLRRAALLHDIGKLGVSNAILDKPGRLTDEEMARVRHHPRYSLEILSKIRGFARIAEIAGAHHERLDGRGYHLGMPAEGLDIEMRILATADVFDALSAERPYRAALPLEEVFKIMEKDSGSALDAMCVDSIREIGNRTSFNPKVSIS